jgi:hypothetical protein
LRGTQKEQLTVGVSNLEINEICELKPWDLPDSVKKSVLRDDDAAHAAGGAK